MKKIFLGLLFIALSGCSHFEMEGEPVECEADYYSNAFLGGNYYRVVIDRFKRNRVGTVFVHPKSNLNLKFYGYWMQPSFLRNIECKGGLPWLTE